MTIENEYKILDTLIKNYQDNPSAKSLRVLTLQANYLSYMSQKEIIAENLDNITVNDDKDIFTVADVFYHYEGTREYEGIVDTIQTWYYGSCIQAAWCATAMCWALAQLGLRAYTITGKYDNVYNLDKAFARAVEGGLCEQIIDTEYMHYGDIVILCFDNQMSPTASKHVTAFVEAYTDQRFKAIGGNQNDSIQVSTYQYKDIYSVYRPHYDKGTLKSLDNLPNP